MEKTIRLTSMHPERYPNMELKAKVIENPSEVMDEIAYGNEVLAQKVSKITARQAKIGEEIVTTPKIKVGNNVYILSEARRTITEQQVEDGSMIVTNLGNGKQNSSKQNPDEQYTGEQYPISSFAKFDSKYKYVGQENGESVYIPRDDTPQIKTVRKAKTTCLIPTKYGDLVVIADASYFLTTTTVDANGNTKTTVDAITNIAFENTYELVTPAETKKIDEEPQGPINE